MIRLNLVFMTLLMALLFMLSACSDDGSGSTGGIIIPEAGYKVVSDGSWEIYNAKGLYAFYEEVSNDNRSLNAKLMQNITLELNSDNSSNWQQITTYHGIFDGDNHTITNVAIHEELKNNLALFNYVYGTVKNVTFENISVEGQLYIAGAVNRLERGGLVENVSIDSNSSIVAITNASGIVYENNGTVINARNYANVISTRSTSNASGVVAINDTGGAIIASYNSGNITGSTVGGVVLSNAVGANVISSYNLGQLNGNAGGIAYENEGTVNGSFALSGVTAINTDTGTTDNVSSVDNVSLMNTTDNLTKLNNAIDDYEYLIKYGYGYKFTDGGQNAPKLDRKPIELRGISFTENEISITPDNTAKLIVETNPINAEYPSLNFSSSDESIVSVSDNGTITSYNNEDNATITVSTEDNAFSATINVTVEAAGHRIVGNTWEIFKANGLVAFREAVNNDNNSLNAILTDNITFNLNSDNSSNWVKFNDYYGIFDGDNHTITNVAMHEQLNDNLAFFSNIYGTVKNVKFDNISIDSQAAAAGVAYRLDSSGEIENVSTDNKSNIKGNKYASGIVNYNYGKITYTHNSATVTSIGDYAGGIVGSNNAKIIASSNSGNITGHSRTGGIAGDNSGEITVCYN